MRSEYIVNKIIMRILTTGFKAILLIKLIFGNTTFSFSGFLYDVDTSNTFANKTFTNRPFPNKPFPSRTFTSRTFLNKGRLAGRLFTGSRLISNGYRSTDIT